MENWIEVTDSTTNRVSLAVSSIATVNETGANTHSPGVTVTTKYGATYTVVGQTYSQLTARLAAAGYPFV